MALFDALASLGPTYHHPIASAPVASTSLNPYLPLPADGALLTTSTYLPSLPAPTAGVVHILGATALARLPAPTSAALISRTSQEAYDHALLSLRLARDLSIAVYHHVAPAALSGDVSPLENAQQWLTAPLGTPMPNGDVPDWDDKIARAFDSVSLSLLKATRRVQRAFTHHTPGAAVETLVLNFTTSDLASENTIDIALAAPLPREKLRASIKFANRLAVVEAGSAKFGTAWASIVDVAEDLDVAVRSILVASPAAIGEVAGALASDVPIVRLGEAEAADPIPSTSIAIPAPESSYTDLLASGPTPLEILNSPASLAASESTSPLYAFGKAAAIRTEREKLVDAAKRVLKAASTKPEVHAALGDWLLVKDEAGSAAAGAKAVAALGAGSSEDERTVVALGAKGHWEKKALWIVVSNAWAADLASSGLHHSLASGLDINLLVYETQASPFSPLAEDRPRERKKDLALYALNMGDVYVASVAVYADYAGVINAMREAEAYAGPALVLAYLPWGERADGAKVGPAGSAERAGPLERLRETKRAVAGGWWPLFRWNPAPGVADDKRFTLDASHIKDALAAFLDRQNHLSQLTRATPALDKSVTGSAGLDLAAARKQKAREAYDRLVNSLDGPGLLVLFASDGGNAEKVAKRLVGRAKMRGVAATIRVLDEAATDIVGTLKAEKNVLVITSTAGQGEAPQNGRNFVKALAKVDVAAVKAELAETRIAVFGMGDSKYWPRKEDYIYYNKPGKDLAARFAALEVAELAPLGLGDDSDPDGYQTGYKPFEAALWRALGVDSVDVVEAQEETVANEHIKIASNYLRGTILEGLEDKMTGAIGASDAQLTKFHGTYMQDDRDIRESLKAQGLEPAYSFMIRVRMPGGVCTPEQWLHMDRIADEHGNGTFKMTTRQTFQFHGVIKSHLKPAMQAINRSLLDTIAACGDVNRNVLCSVNPTISTVHKDAYDFSKAISERLLPATTAYHEIWLDKKPVFANAVSDLEPLYGPVYLPRKFKIAVAVPPDNSVDVFTNDVGFIAIVEGGKIVGYNVSVGGGMGVTHSNKKTYPRLGDVIGFVTPEDGTLAAEKIMLVQRDNGNRADRKNARLKYTIDRMTLPVFKAEVEKYMGKAFEPARPYAFDSNLDHFGWSTGDDGKHHFTLFIENGRVEDSARHQFKTGLQEVARAHTGTFRLTANQHVVLSDVDDSKLDEMKRLLAKHGLDNVAHSGLRLASSACVAFPTCGLAMAESERYLPVLIDKIEKICEDAGVGHDALVLRMSGCPNGCSRPWAAEVAFVGKAPGSYMMLLGGSYKGERLNKPFRESVTEPEILDILGTLIRRWAKERDDGERFGDWTVRAGIVKPTVSGKTFWDDSCVA
ncbi:Sulfite reductase [NADPH] subunit beta [Cryptotrichosporon argae]